VVRIGFVTALLPFFYISNVEAQVFSNNGHMIPLRCEDWKKNEDGSWSQTKPIIVGAMTIKGYTLWHSAETRLLDQKCD
jgi:hypothetical protein